MEAFPQVVQEGTLTRVGVQENKILDANAITSSQGGLHVPQDPVAPLLQALFPSRSTLAILEENKCTDNILLLAQAVLHLSTLVLQYMSHLFPVPFFCQRFTV